MLNKTTAQDHMFACNSVGDRYLPEFYPQSLKNKEYSLIWESSFSPIQYEQDHTYIFTGTDCGLLIKAFSIDYSDNPLSLIFVEDKSFIEAVRHECADELAQMEFVKLLTIAEFKESTELHQFDNSLVAGRMSAIKCASVSLDNSGMYKAIEEKIHFLMNSHRWSVMNTVSRLPFLEQRLTNIPEMTVPTTLLSNRFEQLTVVVLAAGPSLDDHIEWVKENRTKLVVIAVSRISKRLLSEGITPDIVSIIDPHTVSYEVSREALEFQPAPILAFSDQGVAEIVSQWTGPKLYTGTRLPWRAEEFEFRVNAPTVSNLAYALAELSNPHQIILLGLDFCLDEAGHTHALGNMEREKGVSLRTDMEEVQTYDGSIRLSSIDYYKSAKSLEKQILGCVANIRTINPSAGAMKLSGVEYVPLAELDLDTPTCVDVIQALRCEIEDKQTDSTWINDSAKQLQQFLVKFSEFRSLALDGKKTVTAAKSNKINLQKCTSKLNKIDHRIRHKHLEQRSFCINNTGHLFSEILDTGAKTGEIQSDESLEKSAVIYTAYLRSIKAVIDMLKSTQNLLRLRKTESNSVWTQELVDHFMALNLPRRILNSTAQLPEGAFASAELLEKQQQNNKTKRLQEVIDTMEVSESSLFTALSGAYTQQSADKLKHFRNVTGQMTDFKHHRIYTLLADAYLAEITDDTDKAMSRYQEIVDTGQTPLLEEALNRIAFLCIRIGDSETAMLTLTVLSEINPMYKSTLDQFKKVA